MLIKSNVNRTFNPGPIFDNNSLRSDRMITIVEHTYLVKWLPAIMAAIFAISITGNILIFQLNMSCNNTHHLIHHHSELRVKNIFVFYTSPHNKGAVQHDFDWIALMAKHVQDKEHSLVVAMPGGLQEICNVRRCWRWRHWTRLGATQKPGHCCILGDRVGKRE